MPLINAARDMVRAEGYSVVGADMEAMRTLRGAHAPRPPCPISRTDEAVSFIRSYGNG